MTNSSLRERFGIEDKNRSMISRMIRDAVDENIVLPYDLSAAPKNMKYVPYWAVSKKTESVFT
jgi:hypothetical protein